MVVYPRWRGELEPCQNGASFVPGLSPLPRGTHLLIVPGRKRSRFIPAGAGNSTVRACSSIAPTVYPRWRGELINIINHNRQGAGLSPLARGTQQTGYLLDARDRFIPAGAGNSRLPPGVFCCRPVYPRWRGELPHIISHGRRVGGLSPLARGTL